MGRSFTFSASVLLALSSLPAVLASRDEGHKAVEVAGSHFVAAKEVNVHQHKEVEDGHKVSASVREEFKAFSAAAMQALADGKSAGMSKQQKAASVQAALEKAAQAVASMASEADMKKTPGLAEKLESLQRATSARGSLLQQHEDHEQVSSHAPSNDATLSPEMQEQVKAFGKAAKQVLADGLNPNMSDEERATKLQAVLAKATGAVSSVASLVDKKNDVALAAHLTRLNELTAPSLLQKQEVGSAATLSPEMMQQIKSFGKLAKQALANGNNPSVSDEERATSLQAALARAAGALTSVAAQVDMTKKPELATSLTSLIKLASPSLLQQQEESSVSTASRSAMTPEMREEVLAFSKIAVQALANAKDTSMSHEEQSAHVQAALEQAAKVMTSVASMADMKKAPQLAEKLATLRELTAKN